MNPKVRRRGLHGVAGAVIAIGLASCSSGLLSLQLQTGASTASIQVTIPHSGQPSFTGTVAGRTLSGTVKPHETGGLGFISYQGDLGGHHYVLHVSLSQPKSP